jgi:hypothetical protein
MARVTKPVEAEAPKPEEAPEPEAIEEEQAEPEPEEAPVVIEPPVLMKVKFTVASSIDIGTASGNERIEYAVGQVTELPQAQAFWFLGMNRAEQVKGDKA